MNVLKDICTNYSVQVSIHEIEHEVDVSVVFCPDDVLEANDVLVTG